MTQWISISFGLLLLNSCNEVTFPTEGLFKVQEKTILRSQKEDVVIIPPGDYLAKISYNTTTESDTIQVRLSVLESTEDDKKKEVGFLSIPLLSSSIPQESIAQEFFVDRQESRLFYDIEGRFTKDQRKSQYPPSEEDFQHCIDWREYCQSQKKSCQDMDCSADVKEDITTFRLSFSLIDPLNSEEGEDKSDRVMATFEGERSFLILTYPPSPDLPQDKGWSFFSEKLFSWPF